MRGIVLAFTECVNVKTNSRHDKQNQWVPPIYK